MHYLRLFLLLLTATLIPACTETIVSVPKTAQIERGDIIDTVSASGSLHSLVTTRVSSQVSGQISRLYADFNSVVRAGQVVARIDPASFQAQVLQAEAELAVAVAVADKADFALHNAEREYQRKQVLLERGHIAQSVLDEANLILLNAKSGVSHARAQVQQREAALKFRQVDLDHTFIKSPIDGVVINRNVEPGQTVAASLQAPTLFTIARDLREMQVIASIDEADIGQIKQHQKVRFSVDAFPELKFHGKVIQIRKSAKVEDDVVTYRVVINATNPDLLLLPGMTANVEIVIHERRDVYKVPNAALRFKQRDTIAQRTSDDDKTSAKQQRRAEKSAELARVLNLSADQKLQIDEIKDQLRNQVKKLKKSEPDAKTRKSQISQLRRQQHASIAVLLNETQGQAYQQYRNSKSAGKGRNDSRHGSLWVLVDGEMQRLEVQPGISNGAYTEISGVGLSRGQQVIVGMTRQAEQDAAGKRKVFGLAL